MSRGCLARIANLPSSGSAGVRCHIIKQSSNSYEFINEIPKSISIIYLVRHLLDVMSSTLSYRERVYRNYISPERWVLEAEALRSFLAAGRRNVIVVRYEQLVTAPDVVQADVGSRFGLRAATSFSDFGESFRASRDIEETLNGVRPPDPRSVGRWKEPDRRAHVAAMWGAIGEAGPWFCNALGYSISEIRAFVGPCSSST